MIYILVANYSFFFKSWGIIVVIYFVIVYYIHGKIIFCEEVQLFVKNSNYSWENIKIVHCIAYIHAYIQAYGGCNKATSNCNDTHLSKADRKVSRDFQTCRDFFSLLYFRHVGTKLCEQSFWIRVDHLCKLHCNTKSVQIGEDEKVWPP